MIPDASNCLLTYSFSTDPSPIQISTPQTPSSARINASASPAKDSTVYCNKILIAYPTGPDVDNVFLAAPAGSLSTVSWSITSQIRTGEELGIGDPNTSYTTFIYQCLNSSNLLINYNLVFGAFGQISMRVGDFQIMVQETSGTTSDPSTFTPKVGSFTLTKEMPRFYLANFVATNPATPTVPVTDFPLSGPIYFEWESNGTFYQIFQQSQAAPVYAGTSTNFTLTAGLTRDTTFILAAMVSGNPSGDSWQGGFEPIYLYSSLTITVSNPVLVPTSVTTGTLAVTGNASVTGNTKLTGTLGVTGPSTVGSLQASSFNVSGNSVLNTATVNGSLGVTGSTTLGGLTVGNLAVNGLATMNGGLATTGMVSLLQGSTPIQPGNYGGVTTDGFVIGYVGFPANNWQNLCVCWIYGSAAGAYVSATGGNHGAFTSGWDKYQTSNSGTFVLPVQRGNGFSISVQQFDKNAIAAPTSFLWVPMGRGANPADIHSLRIGDAYPPEGRAGGVHRIPISKSDHVPELVSVIEAMLGKPIGIDLHKRLMSVLHRMNEDEFTVENH
jgi:hypothetical protein